VRIALVFPELLGTYGDGGNATILAQRLRWRDIPAEVLVLEAEDAVPDSCDLYLIGGGEDLPQALAAARLISQGSLRRATEAGATVLAVCAGLQILGTSFVGPDGRRSDGLGLLDCETTRGSGPRAVGEIVVDPPAGGDLPTLTGYENHGGVTRLGVGASPLGQVRHGVGNGDGSTREGVRAGKVLGTYLHGPVLARNPALADLLLSWVVGPLAPLDDAEAEGLRAERLERGPLELAASARARTASWRRWLDRLGTSVGNPERA
jgi:CobQ-like glutamine amidotransferase family enzyme